MIKLSPAGTKLTRYFSVSHGVNAVPWPKAEYGPMEVQRSAMLNGIKVAAARPMGSQVAACTIMYQAGSRYEYDDLLGASHFIRVMSTGTGCGYSAFSKMRYLQQQGASITCATDRQTVSFSMRCPLVYFPELKYYLLDVATRCRFLPWEIIDRKPIIREDLTRLDPEARVMDLVQRACWAGTLGNSIYCEDGRIDSMSSENLKTFVDCNFSTENCTVASVGVPFEETLKLAEKIEFTQPLAVKQCESYSCPRGGFELCDLGRDGDTWIALAVPGTGTCDLPCLLKHAILAESCGTGNVQDGLHALDRTLQPPIGLLAGEDVFTQYKTFNLSYKETGIFGVLIKTNSASAWNATLAGAEFLGNVGDITFKQIDTGKRRLKLGLALNDEDCVLASEGLALQMASDIQIDSSKNSIAMIDALCPHEIRTTAQAISERRTQMAVAVVGDIAAVPHDREILYNACLQ